ncbi:MAG: hypothetical protein HC900_00095 [Methylacidiphilales bacterium]|nr:hypothetical protein [Candidatus Methylacidiphilales bacterium]
MIADDYTPQQASRSAYDFSGAKPGQSYWFATADERLNAYNAFKRWKSTMRSNISARTMKVGKEDPRGPGYRMVFDVEEAELKTHIAAIVYFYDQATEHQRFGLNHNGITSDDDIRRILAQEGLAPTTISEAKAIRRKLIWGDLDTIKEWCEAAGRKTWRDTVEETQRKPEPPHVRPNQPQRPPEARALPATPAATWARLSDEQRAKLRRQGITDDRTYLDAFVTCHPAWSDAVCVDALVEGHADFCAWLRFERDTEGSE